MNADGILLRTVEHGIEVGLVYLVKSEPNLGFLVLIEAQDEDAMVEGSRELWGGESGRDGRLHVAGTSKFGLSKINNYKWAMEAQNQWAFRLFSNGKNFDQELAVAKTDFTGSLGLKSVGERRSEGKRRASEPTTTSTEAYSSPKILGR